MVVKDIMNGEVIVVDAESSLLDAAVKMKLYDVGMVVVVQDGHMVGVVTDRDIVVRGVAESADPTLFAVQRIMTTKLITCNEADPVEQAQECMERHQVRRLIVVDSRGVPVGVVGVSDIARKTGRPHLAGETLEQLAEPSMAEAMRPRADD